MIIKKIKAEKTFELRHPILRKGLPVNSCKFENDTNSKSLHLGAFEGNKLIGVISALPNKCNFFHKKKAYQIRGLAVLEKYRRKGIASALIEKTEIILKEKYLIDLIWLNSRIIASELYLKNNYISYGEPFDIKISGTHQRFYKFLDLKFIEK
mgnify:CR=1 FL=1|tara:strand:- start:145 stop:603 length:459 start_codon:yes stop_codon:yes gene_type:complete